MNIIAITTCVNYSDHLVWLLQSLRGWVDGVAVVTETNDYAIEVCRKTNATPIVFDGWRERGATFNKAGAIRHAQGLLYAYYPDHWYLIVDADCVLPDGAHDTIRNEAADDQAIYFARRVDFHTPEELASGVPTKTYGILGAGYFQLYKRHVFYPEWSVNAGECDLEFTKQFYAARVLSLTVGHCGEEGRNWDGRASRLWVMSTEQINRMANA